MPDPADNPEQLPPALAAHASAIQAWLIGEARFIENPDLIVEGFVRRVIGAGIPLDRMLSYVPTLYAARQGMGRIWSREEGVRLLDFSWDSWDDYENSPLFPAHQTRDWVGFRIDEVDDKSFGIVAELRAGGFTHYLCMPVFFRDGAGGGVSYATRHADGFSEAHQAFLRAIEDAVAITLDLNRAWILLKETLGMYVGAEPSARILSGQVRRGEVVPIRSAIVFADMRGFTALSGQMSGAETVALLNRYFDCVVPPIEAAGGEVLKYIGDGVLAIFRAEEEEETACAKALQAALKIVERVQKDRSQAVPAARFDVKTALHFGEVAYGNIGSGARLDYTVVGGGVNLASRLADLAGKLERRILVSSVFAKRLPDHRFQAMGEHALRGIAEPQSAFAPVMNQT